MNEAELEDDTKRRNHWNLVIITYLVLLKEEVRPVWKMIQNGEMTRTGGVLSYQCRCGGEFSFRSLYEVLREKLIMLECD